MTQHVTQEPVFELPVMAEVQCSDGLCGRVVSLVAREDPLQITHLVVEDGADPPTRRLVDIGDIVDTNPQRVAIKLSSADLSVAQSLTQTVMVAEEITTNMRSPSMGDFTAVKEPRMMTIEQEQLPPGGVTVDNHTEVRSSEDSVGRLDMLLIERGSGLVTHLLIHESGLLNNKRLTIPAGAIDRFSGATIRLNLSHAQVESLPAV